MSKKSLVGVEGDHVECTQCTCVPPKLQNQKKIVECHQKHLKNWQKWIAERKQIHERLTKSLNRSAGDLLMNLDEEYRTIQEERLLFEYCKINTNFDKYRGNPAFWKVPAGLTDKCNRSFNPTYFANMTKVEKNEIPLIEHVATPNYVKNEKNLLPCNRHLYATRKIDINTLSPKINQIVSYRPECDELVIVGEKLLPKNERPNDSSLKHNLTKELENGSSDEQKVEDTVEQPFEIPRICFEINETLISEYNDLANSVLKIRLIFECTTNQKTPKVKYIKFKNKGLATVRFYWNRVENFLLFRDLIKCDKVESHTFYFNKNELLLPPNEKLHFPIWFKPSHVGNYLELWEITTNPKMWDADFKLIVNLQGFVYPNGIDEQVKYIREMLDERMVKTAIRNVLNDILQLLKFAESEADNIAFTERQLFECANHEVWGIERRPKYIYGKDAVRLLTLLYEEIKLPHAPDYWNYSIKELLMMARKKDIWIYVENETKKMLKNKQRRVELNTSTQENVENEMPVIELRSVFEDENETYCRRLDGILQNLERPSMIPNTERLKYFTVYSIIRYFSLKICNALEKCDNSVNPACDDCYPSCNYDNVSAIEQMPERLLFERFDDIWIDRAKANTALYLNDFIAMPKPDILKNVGTEDLKSLYKIYFKIADIDERSKKKSNRNEEQEKTSRSKETQAQDQIAAGSYTTTVKEDFDPFGEEYVPNISQKVSVPSIESTCSVHQIDFDYHKYLIVSTYLTEAVDAMVDALETFKENTLDVEVLAELTKCGDVNVEEFQYSSKKDRLPQQEVYDAETAIPGIKLTNNPYFYNLLDSHLNKNQHTKEYIVEGKRKVSRDENLQPNVVRTSESDSFDSWIFKSRESLPESVKSEVSVGIQTSEIDDNFKASSKELLKNVTHLPSTSSSASESEKVSHDIVYFVNDEEEVLDERKPSN